MGFGTELQGKLSHEALTELNDAEVQFLETAVATVKARAQADREYAVSLKKISAAATRSEPKLDYSSPIFDTWFTIVKDMETLSSVLSCSAELLSNQTLDVFVKLLNDKKHARRLYLDDRTRVDAEYFRLQEEVARYKSQTDIELGYQIHFANDYNIIAPLGRSKESFGS